MLLADLIHLVGSVRAPVVATLILVVILTGLSAILLLTVDVTPNSVVFGDPGALSHGTVKSLQKISSTAGGFDGTLDDGDLFGAAVANLGDLDGDEVLDLAVGSYADDDGGTDRGALGILFLNADGTVKAEQKISDIAGGFSGDLDDGDNFSESVTSLGDLNGDEVLDVALGAMLDDDGGLNRGAVWILFLNADGTVKAEQKISDTAGGFAGKLGNGDFFGFSVSRLGDGDGDGIFDLAVGAPSDDDGGLNRGAVWLLLLNADGTVKSERKISDSAGGFAGNLNDGDFFGFSVSRLGDIDGDGVFDTAVGAARDSDGGVERGSLWALFMNPGCVLELNSSYSKGVLVVRAVVGTIVPARMDVLVMAQGEVVPIRLGQSLPITEPPVTQTMSQAMQPRGVVRLLATMTTVADGIIRSAFGTVDTGSPS